MRLDKYLAEYGFAKSRESAQRLIRDGSVMIENKVVTKSSFEVDEASSPKIEIIGEQLKYVSRGGLKLERALDCFNINPSGLDAVDIGASTGGFTDCLLQRGIKSVRCIDVGRSQLDPKIEADSRVTSYEGMNARYVEPQDIGGKCELVVCDVSFISLTLIIPTVSRILQSGGCFVALIKPQFEAGRSALDKRGIVRDRKHHIDVIEKVFACAESFGLMPSGLTASPIEGGDGNREYLARFDFTETGNGLRTFDKSKIAQIVYS